MSSSEAISSYPSNIYLHIYIVLCETQGWEIWRKSEIEEEKTEKKKKLKPKIKVFILFSPLPLSFCVSMIFFDNWGFYCCDGQDLIVYSVLGNRIVNMQCNYAPMKCAPKLYDKMPQWKLLYVYLCKAWMWTGVFHVMQLESHKQKSEIKKEDWETEQGEKNKTISFFCLSLEGYVITRKKRVWCLQYCWKIKVIATREERWILIFSFYSPSFGFWIGHENWHAEIVFFFF